MIKDKNNALGNQERELLLYSYMMNNKMKKKDVIINDIIEIKDSFMKDMKSMNQSHINQSCDALLAKLNHSESNINNQSKANFNLNNSNLNVSNLNVSNANIHTLKVHNTSIMHQAHTKQNTSIVGEGNQSLCHVKLEDILKDDEFEYNLNSSSDIVDVESILPNDKDSLCDSGIENEIEEDVLDAGYEKMKRDGELGYI